MIRSRTARFNKFHNFWKHRLQSVNFGLHFRLFRTKSLIISAGTSLFKKFATFILQLLDAVLMNVIYAAHLDIMFLRRLLRFSAGLFDFLAELLNPRFRLTHSLCPANGQLLELLLVLKFELFDESVIRLRAIRDTSTSAV